ncbi:MAG: hypothetical protein ABII64_04710 [Elusimicrobiota bacterium]
MSENSRVIDTPMTGMIGYGNYTLDFRLFSEGGVLTRLEFGVFKIVNLGFGWEVSRVIGTENAVVGPPGLLVKLRPFEGGMVLPAIAIGYDGQGNYFDKTASEFTQKEKGIFIVFGREMLTPGLEINVGCNMNDFKKNTVFGFTSIVYTVEDKAAFLAEWDRVNYIPDSFVNAGIRMFVTESLYIDVAGRDIGAYEEKTDPTTNIITYRKPERIVKISYSGRF